MKRKTAARSAQLLLGGAPVHTTTSGVRVFVGGNTMGDISTELLRYCHYCEDVAVEEYRRPRGSCICSRAFSNLEHMQSVATRRDGFTIQRAWNNYWVVMVLIQHVCYSGLTETANHIRVNNRTIQGNHHVLSPRFLPRAGLLPTNTIIPLDPSLP